MGWIDYKKAYGMVPHGWMIEAMKMVELWNLFENSKETWRTELAACNESLGEVEIRRLIFQGDCFSALLFVVVLILFVVVLILILLFLSIILNEAGLGYATSRNQKSLVYGPFKAVCRE